MRPLLLALLWLVSIASLAHAGGVTTTTTATTTTTSTSLPPTTSSSTTTSSTTLATTTSTSTTVTSTTSTSLPSTTSSTSTSSSTTLLTTTTTSSSSTTTTLQPSSEQCGNCLDDDGDGLTDFEDADCCETPPSTLSVEQLRLRVDGDTSQLALSASALPSVTSLSPATHTLFIQLADDDDEPGLCATIDAVHFRGRKSKATFTDRTDGVPSAGGISAIRLQRQKTGAVHLKVTGSDVAFGTQATDHLRIAVALRSLAEPGNPTRCAVRTLGVIGAPTNGLARP